MRQTAAEALMDARALIERPEKWWNGVGEPPADRMCVLQAVQAALRDQGAATVAYTALSDLCGGYAEIYTFQGTHSHAEALALFDRAIELARERELQAA